MKSLIVKQMSIFLIVMTFIIRQNLFAVNSVNTNGLEITFISNCGFLIKAGDKKILLDLEDPEKSFYKTELLEAYNLMYNNKAPFDDVNLLLISHPHADHLGAKEVTKYLSENSKVKMYSTVDVLDEIKKKDLNLFNQIKNNIETVNPFDGKIIEKEIDGIKIEFLGTYHAGAPNYVLKDLCFIIHFGETKIFYMSDIDPGYENNLEAIRQWSSKKEKIDLLFAPDVVLYLNEWSSQKGIDAIKNFIKPKKIIATHLNPKAIEESKLKVRENFLDVNFFDKSMEKIIFQPKDFQLESSK